MKKKKLQSRNFNIPDYCRCLRPNLLSLVLLLMLIMPMFSIAGVSDTINYLKTQTQDAWTSQALVALGESNVTSSYLTSVSGTLATDYAKTILAVVAVGENPKFFGNIDYVAKLKIYHNNNQMGDISLLNDDMWSILALSSAGEQATNEIIDAKNYIISNQNVDGGWSYMVGGTSDTNDTAAAIVALLEAGVSKTDSIITDALAYLKSVQNDDAGFGWQVGSNSDSGSDSWVLIALNKLEVDMSDWEVGSKSPLDHLKTLEDSDGGYWWVEPGTSDYNNKAMTSYAAIAVMGKSFPVVYFEEVSQEEDGYALRIEGADSTICNINVDGVTALDLVKNALTECNYTYVIEDTSYGPYLSKINNDVAEGTAGWMYFVNNESPLVGAADYILSENDEVLFYYGEWGMKPTRLVVTDIIIDSGESFEINVEYYQDSSWTALKGAKVVIGELEFITDINGNINASLNDGIYSFFATKTAYVRTNSVDVTVGSGVSQNVDLVVEIKQSDDPVVGGESLIFEVTPGQLNFGKIIPGQSNIQTVDLKNAGTVSLDVTSFVSGDNIFTDNIKVNSEAWSVFEEDLVSGENKDANVKLLVPEAYLGSGVKTGELIFWAKPN